MAGGWKEDEVRTCRARDFWKGVTLCLRRVDRDAEAATAAEYYAAYRVEYLCLAPASRDRRETRQDRRPTSRCLSGDEHPAEIASE
jgi:hypothetical protein